MIDTRKNLCYLINISYIAVNGEGRMVERQKTIVSLHSISTDKFKQFALKKAKEDKQFHHLSEEWASQRTIPLSDFCK